MMYTVLIIDDEISICKSLMFALEDQYQVLMATNVEDAIKNLDKHTVDAVLLDMRIGGKDGISLIGTIKEKQTHAAIIMMTAYGTIQTSVKAMKAGAYHYLTKPLDLEEVKLLLDKAIQFNQLKSEVSRLSEIVHPKDSYEGIIGKSLAMKTMFQLLDKVKQIDSNLLITGESGTGKESVAKAIHYSGTKKVNPFLVINCAAIPENLLESELFGYEKGAFTGATSRKQGVFESADKGSIFLDEIGEMPLNLQAKILRVIQEREVVPLGSVSPIKIDVRIICATNRDLSEEVEKGNFREDLYYRLNVIPLHMPALREREGDIPLMIDHFLKLYQIKMQKKNLILSFKAKELLYNYSYPGNVRELSNIIEYAVALSDKDILEVEDFPNYLVDPNHSNDKNTALAEQEGNGLFLSNGLSMKNVEKKVILHTLGLCEGRKKQTAYMLGISERNLRDKLNAIRLEQNSIGGGSV